MTPTTNIDETTDAKLPWWTWAAALIIIHLGTEISLLFKYDQGVVDYYLPTALSLILINWWGPARVLPVLYLNAVFSTYLWGIPGDRWYQWFVYAIPETVFVALSWYLFRKVYHGKYWLPSIYHTWLFLVFGILIPVIPELILLQGIHIVFGDQTTDTFWTYVLRNWMGEFTSCFGLALPCLYYFTPLMFKAGLIKDPPKKIPDTEPMQQKHVAELIIVFVLLLFSVFIIEFEKFWYIYGLFSLYVAIRFGFGPAVITNYYIFLITYVLPKLLKSFGVQQFFEYPDVMNIFLGASLLFVFAAFTGRVITDLKIAETRLQKQNRELDHTNKELDRFVYSVSHDLTAPLKSILGLVNISRLAGENHERLDYLDRIETSVKRLEFFIAEILDYSKNKRREILAEQIQLRELCREAIENLRYMDGFNQISFDISKVQYEEITQDKMRLKIILNNLLSNAIKFRKKIPGHQPLIRISSRKSSESIWIDIEDNGEGIREEYQGRIFDMFFRATDSTKGAGLGLYIALETALRIQGNISLRSTYGMGSIFTLELKNLNPN